MSLDLKAANGIRYAHVHFKAPDPAGHRLEVEEAMAWIKAQPDAAARAVFEGMDKIDISEHMAFYRQKATEARPKCGAFAFVGITGMSAIFFNYIILFAGMPMRMVPTLQDAVAWISSPDRESRADKA
jgi:hypothetical protein